MNVRSKFDTDEPEKRKVDHMRGMCGMPYEMFEGPARVDTTGVKGPKFLQRIFQLLGWKTRPAESK
jgi:hypothetical protein